MVGVSEHLGKWKSNSPVFSIWNGIGVAAHVGTAIISYTVVNDNHTPWTTHTEVSLCQKAAKDHQSRLVHTVALCTLSRVQLFYIESIDFQVKVNPISNVVLKNENIQYLSNVVTARSKTISVPVYLKGVHNEGSNVIGWCTDSLGSNGQLSNTACKFCVTQFIGKFVDS